MRDLNDGSVALALRHNQESKQHGANDPKWQSAGIPHVIPQGRLHYKTGGPRKSKMRSTASLYSVGWRAPVRPDRVAPHFRCAILCSSSGWLAS